MVHSFIAREKKEEKSEKKSFFVFSFSGGKAVANAAGLCYNAYVNDEYGTFFLFVRKRRRAINENRQEENFL